MIQGFAVIVGLEVSILGKTPHIVEQRGDVHDIGQRRSELEGGGEHSGLLQDSQGMILFEIDVSDILLRAEVKPFDVRLKPT